MPRPCDSTEHRASWESKKGSRMRDRVEREMGSLNKRGTVIYLTSHLHMVPWLQTPAMLPADGMTPRCVSRADPKPTPTVCLTLPLLMGLSYLASPLLDPLPVFLHLDDGGITHLTAGDLGAFFGSCFSSPFSSAVVTHPDVPRSSLLVVCLSLDSVLSLCRLAPATISSSQSQSCLNCIP